MISRIWHGWTKPENADSYQQLLLDEIFHAIAGRKIPGFQGIELLRRDHADEAEFATIMWFDDLAAVKEFAGADYEIAVVPAKARSLLSRWDERSAHYTVVRARE
jgi:heme-degrading monooxygenase HmoA